MTITHLKHVMDANGNWTVAEYELFHDEDGQLRERPISEATPQTKEASNG